MDLFPWRMVERRSFLILNSIWTGILISFKMFQRNDWNLPSLNSNSYIIFCICGIISEIQISNNLFFPTKVLGITPKNMPELNLNNYMSTLT